MPSGLPDSTRMLLVLVTVAVVVSMFAGVAGAAPDETGAVASPDGTLPAEGALPPVDVPFGPVPGAGTGSEAGDAGPGSPVEAGQTGWAPPVGPDRTTAASPEPHPRVQQRPTGRVTLDVPRQEAIDHGAPWLSGTSDGARLAGHAGDGRSGTRALTWFLTGLAALLADAAGVFGTVVAVAEAAVRTVPVVAGLLDAAIGVAGVLSGLLVHALYRDLAASPSGLTAAVRQLPFADLDAGRRLGAWAWWLPGSARAAASRGDDEPGTTDGPDVDGGSDELVPDSLVVQRILESNEGRLKQGAIVEATGWSKSKVSRRLSRMADDGRIVKVRLGRENLICLDGAEPDVVSGGPTPA